MRRPRPRVETNHDGGLVARSVSSDSSMKSSEVRSGERRTARPGVMHVEPVPLAGQRAWPRCGTRDGDRCSRNWS